MRRILVTLALSLAAGLAAATAQAAPISAGMAGIEAAAPLVDVQYVCDPQRCINPRTGAYTQSNCNARGCYPSSGVVGYVNQPPAYGRGRNSYDYDDGYDRPRRGGYGDGRFDCNRSRCIDTATGRLYESTCNRQGCFPLRPARGGGRGYYREEW